MQTILGFSTAPEQGCSRLHRNQPEYLSGVVVLLSAWLKQHRENKRSELTNSTPIHMVYVAPNTSVVGGRTRKEPADKTAQIQPRSFIKLETKVRVLPAQAVVSWVTR